MDTYKQCVKNFVLKRKVKYNYALKIYSIYCRRGFVDLDSL